MMGPFVRENQDYRSHLDDVLLITFKSVLQNEIYPSGFSTMCRFLERVLRNNDSKAMYIMKSPENLLHLNSNLSVGPTVYEEV